MVKKSNMDLNEQIIKFQLQITFNEGELVIDLVNIDHNTKYSCQNNYLDTFTFTHWIL